MDTRGGKITKHQLASWILVVFSERELMKQRKQIRADHFDRAIYLATMARELRNATKKGADTTDIEAQMLSVLSRNGSKRSQKNIKHIAKRVQSDIPQKSQ